MFVRLLHKFAPVLNGLDISKFQVGEVIELSNPMARMLLAEGWAERLPELHTPSEEERASDRSSDE